MDNVKILYENDEILIIIKPIGLSVQGGQNITHSLDKDFSEQLGYKIYLVHRLDKDTYGIMIVAKNPKAAAKWTRLISTKEVKKEYIAICCGFLSPSKGIIREDLVQHGQKKFAVTNYKVEKQWTYDCQTDNSQIVLSKIRLILETGRMHQIRIHLSKQNCPIAGDDQHGNFKLNKLLKKELKIKHLLLASVKLTVPINNQNQIFEIPLPQSMDF